MQKHMKAIVIGTWQSSFVCLLKLRRLVRKLVRRAKPSAQSKCLTQKGGQGGGQVGSRIQESGKIQLHKPVAARVTAPVQKKPAQLPFDPPWMT
jgi:hypothetical protein